MAKTRSRTSAIPSCQTVEDAVPNVVWQLRVALIRLRIRLQMVRQQLMKAETMFLDQVPISGDDWPQQRQALLKRLQLQGLSTRAIDQYLKKGWCGVLDALNRHIPKMWRYHSMMLVELAAVGRWIEKGKASRFDRFSAMLRRWLVALEHDALVVTKPPVGSTKMLNAMLGHLHRAKLPNGVPPEWEEIVDRLRQVEKPLLTVRTPFDWCHIDFGTNRQSTVAPKTNLRTWTMKALAKRLQLSVGTIRNACKSARLPRPAAGERSRLSPQHISRIARQRVRSRQCSAAERMELKAILKELGEPALDKPMRASRKRSA